jgi:hypothetical protein
MSRNREPVGERAPDVNSLSQSMDGTERGKPSEENTMNHIDWEKSVLCIVGAFFAAFVTVVTVYGWF